MFYVKVKTINTTYTPYMTLMCILRWLYIYTKATIQLVHACFTVSLLDWIHFNRHDSL
jgi:hypothetical protein